MSEHTYYKVLPNGMHEYPGGVVRVIYGLDEIEWSALIAGFTLFVAFPFSGLILLMLRGLTG